ncbi:expressed unknown protein [Seminavis robusta]|uniref:Uncharacterized protein n=1 Tax=Seminavis robusta TaxID=568900 RepID=A0A9N8DVZ2_9STRA|nr:expressed unknown protein [Seminavis robusta]|eukprot:Sro316_g115510.1 n/a (530) ;mRNA; f:29822-31411
MALTLLVAGAYAGYIAKQQAEMAKYDESIQVEGKTKVSLLRGEKAQILEIPLTCINWFEGDYRQVVPHLRKRVDEILQKNPFLAGWLLLDKDDSFALSLLYDATGQDLNNKDKIFQVYDNNHPQPDGDDAEETKDDQQKVSLTPNTSYAECTKQLRQAGAMLPLQHELIGKNSPIFRVSIIPDAEEPTARFALVVSKTHALGDSHTFYKLIGMLDIEKGFAQQLMVEREQSIHQMARDKMGDDALNYLSTAFKKPPVDLTETRNEPTVMKVFHVKESWFPHKHKGARRASMFAEVAQDYTQRNSTISENSIMASWFFRLTQADIAFMGLSLRDRLDGCLVGDFHAGNYVAGIPYTPADYATPELVEQSVARLKRCGDDEPLPPFRWNNSASIALNWAHRFQNKLQLLPSGEGDCNHISHLILFDAEIIQNVPGRLSLCYMFTSVPSEAKVGSSEGGIEVVLPGNDALSMADLAAQLAAELEDGDGDEDAQDEAVKKHLHGKRAGLLVVCRQSVWDEIEKSGIVDEMIVE